MEEVKVTVIAAVYNVEKYIDRCIESICMQTYQNLEIILIDDGSKDSSGCLCDKWAEKDDRISVVHQNNQGVSAARNAGINAAHGSYILFADSDDYLEKDMIKTMVNNQKPGKLTICGYYIDLEKDNCKCSTAQIFDSTPVTSLDKMKVMDIYRKSLLYAVWNKLYLTDILNNSKIRFEQGLNLGEDALFNIFYLTASNFDFCVVNMPLYHYIRRNNESLDQKYNPHFFNVQVKVFESLKGYGEKIGISKSDRNSLLFYYFNALIVSIDNLYCSRKKMTKKDFRKKMTHMINHPQYMRLIMQMYGGRKMVCMLRYRAIRRGAFAADFRLREFLKRKLGVK